MNKNEIFKEMQQAIVDGDKIKAKLLAQKVLSKDINILESIEKGYTIGLQKVGELWEKGEYFLPELIVSAECMKEVMKIFKPELQRNKIKTNFRAKIVIGTVEGDIHDIGKNLVASLLSANGFEIIDLGADVKLEKFINVAENENADFICLSALLTTTMLGQKKLIEMIKERKLKKKYKILVGGAPVTKKWAVDIGSDGYAENAMTAVSLVKDLIGRKK